MIREFRTEDTDAVLAIWLDASLASHAFIDAAFWRGNVQAMRDVYLPLARTWVYEKEGEVVGFISMNGEYVAALFVAPKWQGRRVGTTLLNHAKTLSSVLRLAVYTENTAACRFYARHGFTLVQERLDETTGHREQVMRWEQPGSPRFTADGGKNDAEP